MDDDKANRRAKSKGEPEQSKAISGVAAFFAFVGSISFALVVGLVPGALQVAGVTSMVMAHVMLLAICLIAVISLWHMELFKERAKSRVTLAVAVVGFFGWLDLFLDNEGKSRT
jgi:predicted lipid-binding transport protein (Tim44 family)